jgi:hypothetical protein
MTREMTTTGANHSVVSPFPIRAPDATTTLKTAPTLTAGRSLPGGGGLSRRLMSVSDVPHVMSADAGTPRLIAVR